MHLEPPRWGRFQIWQTHMYGTGKIDSDEPAEIYNFRPMPCTPAGDLVGKVKTGEEALRVVAYLNSKNATLEEAKEYIGH